MGHVVLQKLKLRYRIWSGTSIEVQKYLAIDREYHTNFTVKLSNSS